MVPPADSQSPRAARYSPLVRQDSGRRSLGRQQPPMLPPLHGTPRMQQMPPSPRSSRMQQMPPSPRMQIPPNREDPLNPPVATHVSVFFLTFFHSILHCRDCCSCLSCWFLSLQIHLYQKTSAFGKMWQHLMHMTEYGNVTALDIHDWIWKCDSTWYTWLNMEMWQQLIHMTEYRMWQHLIHMTEYGNVTALDTHDWIWKCDSTWYTFVPIGNPYIESF